MVRNTNKSTKRKRVSRADLTHSLALRACIVAHVVCASRFVTAAEDYASDIHQILKANCFVCHAAEKREAELDLASLWAKKEFADSYDAWRDVAERVKSAEMPPEESKKQLSAEDRQRLLAWVNDSIARDAEATSGHPGEIPFRRLTRGEYSRTIRAITGQEIDIELMLPVDRVGKEGFGNSAASQLLTSGHLDRYLRAAIRVSEHARILPSTGLIFESEPASSGNTRHIQRAVDVVRKSYSIKGDEAFRQFDLGLALYAVWRQSRDAGESASRLSDELGLSASYIETVESELARSMGRVSQATDRSRGLTGIVEHADDGGPALRLSHPTTIIESTWVKQLLIEPFTAVVNNKSIDREKAKRRCKEIGDRVGWLHATSYDMTKTGIPFYEVDRLYKFDGIYRDQALEHIHEIGQRRVLRYHVALTDAGNAKARQEVYFYPGQQWAKELNKRLDLPLELRRPLDGVAGAKTKSEPCVRLPVPSYFTLEWIMPPDQVKRLEQYQAAKDDKSRKDLGKKLGEIGREMAFEVKIEGEPSPVQILVDVKPIRDADGNPVTKVPQRGQVLPGADLPYMHRSGWPICPKPSITAHEVYRAADELHERFIPYHQLTVYHGKMFFIGTMFNTIAYRHGYGPEVRAERHPFVDEFFNRHVFDKRQAKEHRLRWLDLWAISREPWGRLDRIIGYYPEIADVEPARRADALSKIEQLPIQHWKHWMRMPKHPAERWRRIEDICAEIEAVQEPHVVPDVLEFAGKAWRRPLSEKEKSDLAASYQKARESGLGIEESARTVIAAILTSPHFLMRVEEAPEGHKPRAIDDHELAVRLSYMLWSEPPDDYLRKLADSKNLATDDGIRSAFGKMRGDRRIKAFVDEFFGQWFHFNTYETEILIDAQRFPAFTPHVKRLLYEQLHAQFMDLVVNDRPVTELLYGDQMMMSPFLARFFGLELDEIGWPQKRGKPIPLPKSDDELFDSKQRPRFTQLYRADVSKTTRRGMWGLGGMLAMSSKPLRTDPIRRAFWIHELLLGRHMPQPPDDAGMLPEDDKLGDGKSVRQRLELHRRQASCAACHQRFDDFGFALERYDALGRWREEDAEGLPIDDSLGMLGKQLPKQDEGHHGPLGLSAYLKAHETDFLDNLCRKLIAFALARDPLPGDQSLIEAMKNSGAANDHRLSAYIEPLLLSPQFRSRHGKDGRVGQAQRRPTRLVE